MSRFNLSVEHDGDEILIHYGFSPTLGFSVSVVRAGQLQITYHSVVADHTGLSGLLDVLAESGVFGREQIQEALCAVVFESSENDIGDSVIRQAVHLVKALMAEADRD